MYSNRASRRAPDPAIDLRHGRGHFFFKPSTVTKSPPQAEQEILLRCVVKIPQKWTDGSARFAGIIERDLGKHVVDDVIVDGPVEEEASDEPKVAVDRAKTTERKGPCRLPVARNVGMRVLQEGDCHQPMVDPEIGDALEESSGLSACGSRCHVEDVCCENETDI